MKNKNKKRAYRTKKYKRNVFIIKGLLISIGVIVVINYSIIGLQKVCDYSVNGLLKVYNYLFTWNFAIAEINYNPIVKSVKEYKYNDKIPIDVVKAEIIKQAKIYGNDEQFMLELASCESTFNNLAKNPISTGRGVYQYLIGTWNETESADNNISRYDYKANIKEANIDIANHEYFRWTECLK